VSSALCGASTGLAMITMMRVVQGVGGAMMVPVGRLVVLRATDKKDIIRAIAYLTWPALVAPVVAPALGGALASYLSWRWIFFVNVPLGIVAFGWALRLVPQVRPGTVPSLDWTGFGLCAGCLGFLVEAASLVSASAVDPGASGCRGRGSGGTGRARCPSSLPLPRPPGRPLVLRYQDFPYISSRGFGVPAHGKLRPVPPTAHVPRELRMDRRQGGGDRNVPLHR